jgi:hypothetical protein
MATNLRPENEYPTLKPGMVYDPEVDYPTQRTNQILGGGGSSQANPFNPSMTNWAPSTGQTTQASAPTSINLPSQSTQTNRNSQNTGTSSLYSPGQGGLLGGSRTVEGNPNASIQTGNQGLQTATNATAGYREIDPIYRSIHAPTETVQGQLTGILDAGSPLMERARAKALASMQSRGLLNSSMAIGAAQGALYDVAVPIATTDAGTYAQASRDNQAVGNDTSQFNANAFNSVEQFNVGQTNDTTRFNAGQGNNLNLTNIQEAGQDRRQSAQLAAQREIAAAQNATTLQAAQMGHANAVALEGMRSSSQALIQGSANAGQIYSQMQANITNIQMDPNLTEDAKRNAVAQQISFAQSGMQMAGRVSNVNFGDTLDWGAAQASNAYVAPAAPAPAAAAPAPVAAPAGGGAVDYGGYYHNAGNTGA